MRPIRLAVLLLLAACRPDADAAPATAPRDALPVGLRIGELAFDTAAPPVALHVELGDGPTARIVDPAFFGFRDTTVAARLDGDTLRFALVTGRAARDCALGPAPDEVLAGPCAGDGDPWTLRLARPERGGVPLGLAGWLLRDGGPAWRTQAGNRVRVHVRAEVETVDLPRAAAFADSAVAANLAFLGESGYPRRLDLFLLEDRAEMARLAGVGTAGHADAFGSAALATGHGAGPTSVQHELMHVVSHNAWGGVAPPGDWLREGVATAAAGRCRGWTLAAVARRLQETDALLPLVDVVGRFRAQDDLVAYLQAGAIVEWLRARHGAAAVRALWQAGEPGLRAETGLGLIELDAEWRRGLADAPPSDARLEAIRGVGCG